MYEFIHFYQFIIIYDANLKEYFFIVFLRGAHIMLNEKNLYLFLAELWFVTIYSKMLSWLGLVFSICASVSFLYLHLEHNLLSLSRWRIITCSFQKKQLFPYSYTKFMHFNLQTKYFITFIFSQNILRDRISALLTFQLSTLYFLPSESDWKRKDHGRSEVLTLRPMWYRYWFITNYMFKKMNSSLIIA